MKDDKMKKIRKKLAILFLLVSAFCCVSLMSGCFSQIYLRFLVYDAGYPNALYYDCYVSGIDRVEFPEDPVREGWDFVGWYFYDDLFTEDYFVNNPINYDTPVVAKFTLKNYTATFVADGEEVGTATFTFKDSEVANAPAVPEKAGYNGSWESYTIGKSDMTINAEYTPITYQISYKNLKGASNPNPTSYTIESNDIVLGEVSTRGYNFLGWTTEGVTEPDKNLVISQGTYGNLEIVANWEPIQYSISYKWLTNLGDDTGVDLVQEYNIEDNFTFAKLNSVIPGMEFLCWATTKSDTSGRLDGIVPGMIGDIDLYAHWQSGEYTITYHNAEGAINPNPSTYTMSNSDLQILDISKAGYTFDGWFEDAEFTTPANTTIAAGEHCDKEFYAKFTIIKYAITYHYDGGNIGDATNPDKYTVEDEFDLVAPEKAGYIFIGFVDGNGNEINGIVPGMTGDLDLYASWQPGEYAITYHNVEGAVNPNPSSYLMSETTDVQIQDASKEGYTFDGWFEDAEFTIPANTTITAGEHCDKEFYAKFTIIEYAISYDYDGGSIGDAINPEKYTIIDEFTFVAPEKDGYTFIRFVDENNVTIKGINLGSTGAKTVKALYSAKSYTVWLEKETEEYTFTFNTNGSSDEIASQTLTVGDRLVYPEIPTRDGYFFAGWYEDELCTGNEYDFTAPLTKDVELFAKWVEETGTDNLAYVGKGIENLYVKIEGVRLAFRPLVSGTVVIKTVGTIDTAGILYEGTVMLEMNDDINVETNRNFSISYYCYAGVTYYVDIVCYNGVGENIEGYVDVEIDSYNKVPAAGGSIVVDWEATVTMGEDFSFNIPSEIPTDKKFVGWFDQNGVQYTDENGAGLFKWNTASNIMLVAKFESITVNLQ